MIGSLDVTELSLVRDVICLNVTRKLHFQKLSVFVPVHLANKLTGVCNVTSSGNRHVSTAEYPGRKYDSSRSGTRLSRVD